MRVGRWDEPAAGCVVADHAGGAVDSEDAEEARDFDCAAEVFLRLGEHPVLPVGDVVFGFAGGAGGGLLPGQAVDFGAAGSGGGGAGAGPEEHAGVAWPVDGAAGLSYGLGDFVGELGGVVGALDFVEVRGEPCGSGGDAPFLVGAVVACPGGEGVVQNPEDFGDVWAKWQGCFAAVVAVVVGVGELVLPGSGDVELRK